MKPDGELEKFKASIYKLSLFPKGRGRRTGGGDGWSDKNYTE